MASSALGEELDCSICQDLYTDPVTLRCGHNFCRVCIYRALNTQYYGDYSCPECRAKFRERPALQKNFTLCNIVDKYRSKLTPQEENKIFCTYCVKPAAKSCLNCAVYLCDKHLSAHIKEGEHILTDPSRSLEKRKCPIHKELLKYYCTEDTACICVSCSLVGAHRGHNMESLDEASEKKKKKLKHFLQNLKSKTQKNQKRVQSLEERRREAKEKSSGESKRVTALFIDLRRRLDDLEKKILSEISRRGEQESRSLSNVIAKLEMEKDELSRKMRLMEELCNMTDPLTVLQEPDTGDLCDPEGEGGDEATGGHDGGDEDTGGHDGGDRGAELISRLSNTLSDIIQGINVTFYVQDPADILLDINTADTNLLISDDLKTATWTHIEQKRPETAKRFEYCPQVMSSSNITSGRHYWDVEVRRSEDWIVGMCYPSIDRRGQQSYIGGNNKSWGLQGGQYNNQYSVRHDGVNLCSPHQISSDRVRIYVDYEAGELSFYELCDPIRHLYTSITTFTEPLHAVLYVDDGFIKISGGGATDRKSRK